MYGAKPSGPGGIVGVGAGIMAGMPGGRAMGGTLTGAGASVASEASFGDLAGGPFGGPAFGGDIGALRNTSGGAWGLSGGTGTCGFGG